MRLFSAILFYVLSAPALVAGTLTVEGEGQVSRAPDHAVIEVSLREQGRDCRCDPIEFAYTRGQRDQRVKAKRN